MRVSTTWPAVPTVCEVCGVQLPCRTEWRRHRYVVHGLSYWARRCRDCDHMSSNDGANARHWLDVHG
jgi:hypothetical protein